MGIPLTKTRPFFCDNSHPLREDSKVKAREQVRVPSCLPGKVLVPHTMTGLKGKAAEHSHPHNRNNIITTFRILLLPLITIVLQQLLSLLRLLLRCLARPLADIIVE